jgi:hypothetical protein
MYEISRWWWPDSGGKNAAGEVPPAGFGDLAGARWTIRKLTQGRSQPAIIGLDRAMKPAHAGSAWQNHPVDDDGMAGNRPSKPKLRSVGRRFGV